MSRPPVGTVVDIVRHFRDHDAPAVSFEGRTLTFRDLDERSNRAAVALRTAGVTRGDRVAYIDQNRPEYFDVVFGAAKLGAVCVAVNWRLSAREVAHVLTDAQAKVLFTGEALRDAVEQIEDDLAATIVTLDRHPRWPTFEGWLAGPGATDPGLESTDDGVALQLYTSGTLLALFDAFDCDFVQGYGLTETSGAVTVLTAEAHDRSRPELLRSCGHPLPGVEVRIVDPDTGADCADGDVGEVLIRSDQVMAGYWKQPEATAEAISSDGWFHSGDAGYLRNGRLYLHDRIKDMIVSGAENVYPAEVENVLMRHPAIVDVAVIGVPDQRWGETVKAVVVLAEGAELSEQDVIDRARDDLARYKCPTSVDFVDELPRNPSGKVLKRELREPYWAGRTRRIS